MRALILVLSLCAVVAFSYASDYRWRLSRQQVLAIAERALVAQHFKLSEYPERTVKQRNQKWYVDFSSAPPPP